MTQKNKNTKKSPRKSYYDALDATLDAQARYIKKLLESGADLNKRDKDCNLTPLELVVGEALNIERGLYASIRRSCKKNTPEAIHLKALLKRCLGAVKLLLEKGANPNVRGEWDSPLIRATGIFHCSFDLIELLLKYGADPDYCKDSRGRTPLMRAIPARHTDNIALVRLLIKHGANVNTKSRDEGTPLMVATEFDNFEIAKLLIAHGADVNARAKKDGRMMTPFGEAKLKNRLKIAKLLVENGAKLDYQDMFIFAVMCGNIAFAKRVLKFATAKEAKKFVNTPDNHGCTPLMYANDVKTAKFFLEFGANVGTRDGNKETALFYAIVNKRLGVVKLLIEKGANIHAKNIVGETPLMVVTCYSYGNLDIAKLLVEKGADINTKNRSGATALIMAAELYNLAMVKFLVENGADVEARDKDCGNTVLMNVAKSPYKKSKILKFLLEHGADVNARNKEGKTALGLAKLSGDKDVVKLLLKYGARE